MMPEVNFAPVALDIIGSSKVDYSAYSLKDLFMIAANKKKSTNPQVKYEFINDLFTSAWAMAKKGKSDQDKYKTLLKTAVNVLLSLDMNEVDQLMLVLKQNYKGSTFEHFEAAINEENENRQLMMTHESL